MKNHILILLLTFLLILTPLITAQETKDILLQPNIIYSQSTYICYPYNLTNQTSLGDCLTYTIYGIDNPNELIKDEQLIYDEEIDIYWITEGLSLHLIFHNETFDLGIANISYDEYIEKQNIISDYLDSVNYSEIEVLTVLYSYEDLDNVSLGERNHSYVYDANGNLIQDRDNYYEYNGFNWLSKNQKHKHLKN